MQREIETLKKKVERLERKNGKRRVTTRKRSLPVGKLSADPLEQFIGAFNSHVSDWVERHDHYLGENFLKKLQSIPKNG